MFLYESLNGPILSLKEPLINGDQGGNGILLPRTGKRVEESNHKSTL